MLRRVADFPAAVAAALRVPVMLALLGGPLLLICEAAGQGVCTAKCKEDAACLEKCEKARSGRPPVKDTKSKASSSTKTDAAKEDWRSGIFDTTSKGGGGY